MSIRTDLFNRPLKFALIIATALSLAACGGGGGSSGGGGSNPPDHKEKVKVTIQNNPGSIEEDKTATATIALRYIDDIVVGNKDVQVTLEDTTNNPQCGKITITPTSQTIAIGSDGKFTLKAPQYPCTHNIGIELQSSEKFDFEGDKGFAITVIKREPPVIPDAPMPPAHNASTPSDVMCYYDGANYSCSGLPQERPNKKITIVNNTDQMVYPVVRSTNLGDPFTFPETYGNDQGNQEYRLYLGYQDQGVKNKFGNDYYLGVKPHTSATYNFIPPALWVAARIVIFDYNPLLTNLNKTVNYNDPPYKVFSYNPQANRYPIISGKASKGINTVALLYHDEKPTSFPNDAPAGLTEYTFKDENLTKFKPGAPNTGTMSDYDISFVDSLYLPIAIQGGNDDETEGWVGINMPASVFKKQLNSLYLEPKRPWPRYNMETSLLSDFNPDDHTKILGGFNAFDSFIQQSGSNYNIGKEAQVRQGANYSQFIEDLTARWYGWVNYYQTQEDPNATKIIIATTIENNEEFKKFQQGCPTGNGRDLDFCKAFAELVYNAVKTATSNNIDPTVTDNLQTVANIIGSVNSVIKPDTARSLMRGVPDYNNANYRSLWYPDPSSPYNLNPYVWFVYKDLCPTSNGKQATCLSGAYAFSFDDDQANIDVKNGDHIYVAVGGIEGFPNLDPYNKKSPKQ
jgi:hypothetical protein